MGDAEGVQVVEGSGDLVGNDLGAVLRNGELALLQVGEEVASTQVLHHDVDVVLVLKDVKEPDDVGVLAHLKDFNFPSLELDVTDSHFLLAHDLDGHQLARLLVDGGLNQAELALAQGFLDFVEVAQGGVANHFLDGFDPLLFFFLSKEVVSSDFVGREDELEGVKGGGAVQVLLRLVLDEDADEVVHALVLVLVLVLVHVELLAQEAVPVLLELGFRGLPDHLALDLHAVLVVRLEEVLELMLPSSQDARGRGHVLALHLHLRVAQAADAALRLVRQSDGVEPCWGAWFVHALGSHAFNVLHALLFVYMGQLAGLKIRDEDGVHLVFGDLVISLVFHLDIAACRTSWLLGILLEQRRLLETGFIHHGVNGRQLAHDFRTGDHFLLLNIGHCGTASAFG